MANYLVKNYKGKYRLKAHIDRETNDFPRDVNGNIDSDDIYIDCAYGNQITHYGHGVLVAYIPSIGRGHNILISIGKILLGEEVIESVNKNYNQLYELLEKEGTIKDIRQLDEEIEFKFKSKDIELIAPYLKPKTGGANISPFSVRNLPKPDHQYIIPDEDLREYKEIIDIIPKTKLIILTKITKDFLDNKLAKKSCYKTVSYKTDMKKKMLKNKEYIHSVGMWNEYISYLRKEVKERLYESK